MSERASYIIAVTGGRDYRDRPTIKTALRVQADAAEARGLRPVLLTGGCPTGADAIAQWEWHLDQRPFVVDPAAFKTRGKGAGPTRNGRMAIGATFAMDPPFHPDVLLVFPGGRGTKDCRTKFEAMGIPIIEVTP